jgi:hypothetical protein
MRPSVPVTNRSRWSGLRATTPITEPSWARRPIRWTTAANPSVPRPERCRSTIGESIGIGSATTCALWAYLSAQTARPTGPGCGRRAGPFKPRRGPGRVRSCQRTCCDPAGLRRRAADRRAGPCASSDPDVVVGPATTWAQGSVAEEAAWSEPCARVALQHHPEEQPGHAETDAEGHAAKGRPRVRRPVSAMP